MLAKLCGWNEPEKREERHLHAHMQVDKALLAQLRGGYMELQGTSARMKMLQGADTPRHSTPPVPPSREYGTRHRPRPASAGRHPPR
jgi:hypothetical protein